MKNTTPENPQQNFPQQAQPPIASPPEKKKIWWKVCIALSMGAMIILLFLIAGGIFGISKIFKWGKEILKTEQSQEQQVELYAPQQSQRDESKKVTKIMTSAGGVLSVQDSNNTLYSLTVPPGALILPTTVSLTPLVHEPLTHFHVGDLGSGVYVGETATFIRPAFLAIKPNTRVPEDNGPAKAPQWGRCTIGSRGFDPEICASRQKVDFGYGINPGKVVMYARDDSTNIVLAPTVPINDEDAYVAEILRYGSYMADSISQEEAKLFADSTYNGGKHYVHEVEVLMHYYALGGDLTPYKSFIHFFGNSDKSYPRDIVKGAIIAHAAGEDDTADKRIQDYKIIMEKNFEDNRSMRTSFYPWPRYAALATQIDPSAKNEPINKTTLISKRGVSNATFGSFLDRIYTRIASYMNVNVVQADSFTDSQSILNEITQIFEAGIIYDRAHLTLGDDDASPDDKVDAIEIIIHFVGCNPADTEMKNAFIHFLTEAANVAKTPEQAERIGDLGDCFRSDEIQDAVNKRIIYLMKNAPSCETLIEKDLSNYGQNECF